MVSEAPPFWWTKADWRAWTLYPVSFLYGRISGLPHGEWQAGDSAGSGHLRRQFHGRRSGQDPDSADDYPRRQSQGLKPGFLSRGYGGSLDVTTVVDPAHHRAVAVGDEPLLLAREALTVISRRRVEGAQRLVKEGADLIIMDDGFQSARLAIDYALLVIDATRGLGNGHIVPGGPVRAPIRQQLRYATALLKVGTGTAADKIVRIAARAAKPCFTAALRGVGGRRSRRAASFSPSRALPTRRSSFAPWDPSAPISRSGGHSAIMST